MRIWNLTPHAMHYDDGISKRVLPSDGVLRLRQIDEPAEPVAGFQTVKTKYAGVDGIPVAVKPGDVLLVSTLVGDCWQAGDRPERVIVLVPDTGPTCRRDDQGRVVSVSRFIRK